MKKPFAFGVILKEGSKELNIPFFGDQTEIKIALIRCAYVNEDFKQIILETARAIKEGEKEVFNNIQGEA